MTAAGIRAEVLADSMSPLSYRLTTVLARFPRSIADEVLTHASLARNAGSSRARPVRHLIDEVLADPYVPVRWQQAQRGMQGGADLEPRKAEEAVKWWLIARDAAVSQAESLLQLGLHKTVPNRLLEPFAWQTMIISGTGKAWDNFFDQRCSPKADPPMQLLAEAIAREVRFSEPRRLDVGQWHLPLVRDVDRKEFPPSTVYGIKALAHLSAARCARVSYLTHAGERSPAEDLRLYDDLTSADPPHWSPLEHPAMIVAPSQVPTLGKFEGDWGQLRHLPAMQ